MSTSILDEIEPPERPDFRRVANGVPYVLDENGKRARYKRSSSAGKILDDDAALVDWRVRTVLVGAAQRPDLMAHVSVLDPERDKKAIRDAAEDCLVAGKGRHRANTGTAIHAMLDHIDLGHDWQPAPQFAPAIDAYLAALDGYGLIPVDVECHCVCDIWRTAGTMDRRYRTTRALIAPDGQVIPIGSVLAGDTKTGSSLEYAAGSYATQIASYADSWKYDVVTDERTPFDPPTFGDWALIMHVLVGDESEARCDVYWVDLNAGREGLRLAATIREWRTRTDLLTPAMSPLRLVSTTLDETESAPLGAQMPPELPSEPGAPIAPEPQSERESEAETELVEWLRGRVRAIVATSQDASTALQRKWPTGVAGLKHDGHTPGELLEISKVLDRIEADYSIPFGERDPRDARAEMPKGYRYGTSDRWAKPSPDDPPTEDENRAIRDAIESHPRAVLLRRWSAHAQQHGIDPLIHSRYALAHALLEFASMGGKWTDDEATTMLDATIRACGYADGIDALGRVLESDAPTIMSAAFTIAAGDAVLLIEASGPILSNIQRK